MVNPTPYENGYVIPAVSLTSQLTIENEDDDELEERERSRSFIESMQENIPSHAKIPSPKLHRKHSGDNHHSNVRRSHSHHSTHQHKHKRHHSPNHSHHFHRSQTSPLLNRREMENGGLTKSYLDPSLFTGRPRRNSDTDSYESKRSTDALSLSWGGEDFRRAKSESPLPIKKSTKAQKIYYIQADDNKPLNGTLNHRESPFEIKPPDVQKDQTLTKRSLEMFSIQQKVEQESCKRKTLKMIDELYAQCESNYQDVESQINFAFLRLSNALNARREELISEAKNICVMKKQSLCDSRERCQQCRECEDVCKNEKLSTESSCEENDSRRNSSSIGSVDDQDELLQCNGILEPWKNDITTDEKDNNNVTTNGHISLENGMLNGIFADILEEGNLNFILNEEITEQFNSLGSLKESLSSPQFSFSKGLHQGVAITGETVYFEIHTRDHDGHPTYSRKDKIQVDVFDKNNKKIDVLMNNLQNNRRSWHLGSSWQSNGSPANSPSSSHTSFGSRFYSPCFTPKEAGKYIIHIHINDVEIASSPMTYNVYPKMDLTFDMKASNDQQYTDTPNIVKVNTDMSDVERRRLMMIRRESSEDGDWEESHWIRQKGDKSTLLRSKDEIPSVIYAATVVSGLCAWKLRVTSACPSITLSVGVGTRTGIPDLDEHFSCDYLIKKENEEEGEKKSSRRISLRRVSSFTRISLTYCVLLDTVNGTVRVISENSNEDKCIKITCDVLENYNLYPFVSLIHHHVSCMMQVCPRPQITLL